MKKCKYCKVEVDTHNDFCPLCFNRLQEVNDLTEEFYTPRKFNETTNVTHAFIFRLFLFISICIITICFFINELTTPTKPWFTIVIFAVLYCWILIAHTILSKQSIAKKIFLQVLAILALLYFAEKLSVDEWLLQYVFPAISMAAVTVLLMIIFISSRRAQFVLGFSIIFFLFGIASALLIIFKVIPFVLLNLINVVICALAFIGMLIFGSNAIKAEVAKKYHL